MLETINDIVVRIADPFLYWTLFLPRDLALFIVSIGSSAVLAVVRLWVTDQKYLHGLKVDKKRLKEKMKAAKKEKNKEEVKRLRTLNGMAAIKALKAEKKPLLWAIIPIALLATWAFNRLDYFPAEDGQVLEYSIYLPITTAGDLVTLFPEQGIEAKEEGWITEVVPVSDHPIYPPHGLGNWTIQVSEEQSPYDLRIRHRDDLYTHPFTVGGRSYRMPLRPHPEHQTEGNLPPATQVHLDEYRPFAGWIVADFEGVPGFRQFFFPPWLIAYLIIVIPFVVIIRRVFKIA
ncbi:MAG: hypothetical protein JJT75_11490 [Opitutales bacterium]|nr:hypothetical protein [Opitutales bacterium]MCH8539205.1 hypothetical protein [Opitutales bacterium]